MQDRKTAKLPGAKGDIAAAIRDAVEESLLAFDSMLPAIVESYDRKKNVAKVRPLIAIVDVNNFSQARRPLSNVPVLALGGGGYVINFPLKKGDLGWVHAADRDITEYKERLRDVAPKTSRSHSFSDSMFVPDIMRNYTISEDDDGAMVIQTTDGTTKIAIHPDWINIKAPLKVVSNSPKTHATGDLQVDGDATINGSLTVKGGLSTGGNLSVAGTSTLKDTTVNGQTVTGGGGGGGDYLTKTEASSTYLTQTAAEQTYLKKNDTSGFLTKTAADGYYYSKTKGEALESKINLHYLYCNGFRDLTITPDSTGLMIPQAVMASKGIILANGIASPSKSGRYKVSASYCVLPLARTQQSFLDLYKNGLFFTRLAANYSPNASQFAMMVTSPGSAVVDILVGDTLSVRMVSANSTTVQCYSTGFLHIEEILA